MKNTFITLVALSAITVLVGCSSSYKKTDSAANEKFANRKVATTYLSSDLFYLNTSFAPTVTIGPGAVRLSVSDARFKEAYVAAQQGAAAVVLDGVTPTADVRELMNSEREAIRQLNGDEVANQMTDQQLAKIVYLRAAQFKEKE